MPDRGFEGLEERKQRRILDAACAEFINMPYSRLTVGRIACRARISRGSFYAYFANKDEMYGYILKRAQAEMRRRLAGCLKEAQGDFRLGFQQMLEELWEDERLRNYCFVYRKMKEEADCKGLTARLGLWNRAQRQEFAVRCAGLLCPRGYSHLSKEEREALIEMGIVGLEQAMVCCSEDREIRERAWRAARTKLALLDRGARARPGKERTDEAAGEDKKEQGADFKGRHGGVWPSGLRGGND